MFYLPVIRLNVVNCSVCSKGQTFNPLTGKWLAVFKNSSNSFHRGRYVNLGYKCPNKYFFLFFPSKWDLCFSRWECCSAADGKIFCFALNYLKDFEADCYKSQFQKEERITSVIIKREEERGFSRNSQVNIFMRKIFRIRFTTLSRWFDEVCRPKPDVLAIKVSQFVGGCTPTAEYFCR